MTADDLYAGAAGRRDGSLTPSSLARWLVRQSLAVEQEGLLVPTDRCRQLAATLGPLQGA